MCWLMCSLPHVSSPDSFSGSCRTWMKYSRNSVAQTHNFSFCLSTRFFRVDNQPPSHHLCAYSVPPTLLPPIDFCSIRPYFVHKNLVWWWCVCPPCACISTVVYVALQFFHLVILSLYSSRCFPHPFLPFFKRYTQTYWICTAPVHNFFDVKSIDYFHG